MSPEHQYRVSELLCSKLCHDLIGPVSAINNGLEFVTAEETSMLDDAVSLIGKSAALAAERLAYFRIAFGASGKENTLKMAVIRQLAESLWSENRLDFSWEGSGASGDIDVSQRFGKLILNLALLSTDCLPKRGQIDTTITVGSDKPSVLIHLQGEKCMLRDDIRTGLERDIPPDSLTVRNIVAHICVQLSFLQGATLNVQNESQNSLELVVF